MAILLTSNFQNLLIIKLRIAATDTGRFSLPAPDGSVFALDTALLTAANDLMINACQNICENV